LGAWRRTYEGHVPVKGDAYKIIPYRRASRLSLQLRAPLRHTGSTGQECQGSTGRENLGVWRRTYKGRVPVKDDPYKTIPYRRASRLSLESKAPPTVGVNWSRKLGGPETRL